MNWEVSTAPRRTRADASGAIVGVRTAGDPRRDYSSRLRDRAKQAPRTTGTRRASASVSVEKGSGPVLTPKKVFDWKIVYDPRGAGGRGTIMATLGDESVTLELKPGDKAKGATGDRFGLFTTHGGGSDVRIYFDDLTYTASSTQ